MYTFNLVWIRENSNLCADSIFFSNSLKMDAVRCTLEKEKFIMKILKTQNCYDNHAPDECMLTCDHNCRCCLQACEMQKVRPLSIKKTYFVMLCDVTVRKMKSSQQTSECYFTGANIIMTFDGNQLYQNNKSFLSYLNEVSV